MPECTFLEAFSHRQVYGRERTPPAARRRIPYIYNVGLDFGTAFTKVVLRDTETNLARPVRFRPTGDFLLPSEVRLKGCVISGPLDPDFEGESFSYLKMAVAGLADPARRGLWLRNVDGQFDSRTVGDGDGVIEALTLYYIAHVLAVVRSAILEQKGDFGSEPDDVCFVNMAVPVAHARNESVRNRFQRLLALAYHRTFVCRPVQASGWRLEEALAFLRHTRVPDCLGEFLYLYPEVSANVQSYIRSPAARTDLHLFVDIGAGTADLSSFIWNPESLSGRPLTYLAAEVLPLGASTIELRATATEAQKVSRLLRSYREEPTHNRYHSVDLDNALKTARDSVKRDFRLGVMRIAQETKNGIPTARQGATHPGQFHRLNLLLGGGGSEELLYRNEIRTVLEQYGVQHPPTLPLPLPGDLEWPPDVCTQEQRQRLFKRLTVAYGLSFVRANLADQIWPDEIPPSPLPDLAGFTRPEAPTKDEC